MNFNFTFPEGLEVQDIAIIILAVCLFFVWRILCHIKPTFEFHLEATNKRTRRAEDDIKELRKELDEMRRVLSWAPKKDK